MHVQMLSAQHSVCVHGKVPHVTDAGLSMMCCVAAPHTASACAEPEEPTYVHPAVASQEVDRVAHVVPVMEQEACAAPPGQKVAPVGKDPSAQGLHAPGESHVGGTQVSEVPRGLVWRLRVDLQRVLAAVGVAPET